LTFRCLPSRAGGLQGDCAPLSLGHRFKPPFAANSAALATNGSHIGRQCRRSDGGGCFGIWLSCALIDQLPCPLVDISGSTAFLLNRLWHAPVSHALLELAQAKARQRDPLPVTS